MRESIVLRVCHERKIHPVEFFDPKKRDRRLVDARLEAIRRFQLAGFSMRGISRMMRRNYDTIRYWVSPKLRAYKRARAIEHRRKYPSGASA